MNHKAQNGDFDNQIQEIINLLDSRQDLMPFSSKVLSTLNFCSNISFDLLENGATKEAFQLLSRLQMVCTKILYGFSPNTKSDVIASLRKSVSLYDRYQKELKTIDLHLDEFMMTLEKHAKNIMLDRDLNNTDSFYISVLFILTQVINNMGAIHHLKNKPDRAIQNFCCSVDIIVIIEKHLNAFQIFSFIIALVNLSFCIEEEAKLDEIGKILCSSIFFIENLETKLEGEGKQSEELYDYLADFSRFGCLFDLNNKDSQKLSEFRQVGEVFFSMIIKLYLVNY